MKRLLFRLLGTTRFLKLLHLGFHFSYGAGLLKNDVVYKYHYFNRHMIKEGDHVLDIGANLGYYTRLFAGWVGKTGHVYAVEPVRIYFDTMAWGVRNYKNVTLYNNALGDEEKDVTLSTPGEQGYLRTGVTHISTEADKQSNSGYTFTARMKQGSKLFAGLNRLDFIKCDIEGYEEYVLPEMKDVIQKHKPIVQVETFGDQAPRVETFLTGLGYKIYDIENGRMKLRDELTTPQYGDLYFIHPDNSAVIERLKKEHLA